MLVLLALEVGARLRLGCCVSATCIRSWGWLRLGCCVSAGSDYSCWKQILVVFGQSYWYYLVLP